MNTTRILEVYNDRDKAFAAFNKVPDGVVIYSARLLWVYPDGKHRYFSVICNLEEARFHAGRHISEINFHSPIPDDAKEYLENLIRKGL